MENRITKIYLLFLLSLAVLLFSDNRALAQEANSKFVFFFADYYSPKTMSNSSEFGVGYLFKKAGLKLNYGRVGLFNDKVSNEVTISVFQQPRATKTVTISPEVSGGILFGNKVFQDDNRIKFQAQAGVILSYFISENMACGITLKSLFYNEGVIPLLGWNYFLNF